MHTSYYLRYLKRIQTVAPLPTTPEKCHRTTLQNAELFFHLTEGNVAFHHALLKFSHIATRRFRNLDWYAIHALAAAKLGCTNLIFVEPRGTRRLASADRTARTANFRRDLEAT